MLSGARPFCDESLVPPLFSLGKEQQMQRRHIKPASTLDQRLEEEAQCLRKEAQGTPPGIQRDMLIRKARQAETAAHMREWLSSPGLQSPK
jgi:hypothetical protein